MSERTIITTVEITEIYYDVDACVDFDKKEYAECIKRDIKDALDVDDVVVTNVQEFVLGDEE